MADQNLPHLVDDSHQTSAPTILPMPRTEEQDLPQRMYEAPQVHTGTIPLRQVVTRPAWNYYDRIGHIDSHDTEHSSASYFRVAVSHLSHMDDSTEEPRKRRKNDLTTSTEVPPPLAPSVEEAYRRKCIQLKTRLNEIEVRKPSICRRTMSYSFWVIVIRPKSKLILVP
jgi:hypothetical protein